MIIRQAKIEEMKKLQKLNQEVFIDNQKYDPDLIMNWAIGEQGKTYFTNLLSNSEAYCLVAEEGNNLVGYIAATTKDFGYRKSNYIEIENMGVNPEYRSKGIGSKLMQTLLKLAREHGYQKAYVNAYFENDKAIDFYKKNGFLKIDVSLEKDI